MVHITRKDRIRLKKEKLFIGRQDQLKAFDSLLKKDRYSILNIHGVGGVGKTSLLFKFWSKCNKRKVKTAWIDGNDGSLIVTILDDKRIYSALKILEAIIHQIEPDEAKLVEHFFNFFEELRKLNEIIGKFELQSIKEDKSSVMSISKELVPSALGGAIGTAIGTVPGAVIGAAIGWMSEKLLATTGLTKGNLRRYNLSDEEAELCLNAERIITSTFIECVNEYAEICQDKLVIFIDDYHQMVTADEWLQNSLLPALSTKIVFVIAGRDPLLNKCSQTDLLEETLKIELTPFSQEEGILYLRKKGISDNSVAEKIITRFGCLPLALTLVSKETEKKTSQELSTSTPVDVRQIVKRLLSQINDDDKDLKEVIEASSVTLTFDADLISLMLGSDSHKMVEKVQQYDFIEITDSGRLYLNDTIREFVLEKLRQERPATLYRWNQKAIEYYERMLQNSPSNDQPIYTWNYLYHRYFGDEEAREMIIGLKIHRYGLDIRTAQKADLQEIVEIEKAIFASTEDQFSVKQLQDFYTANKKIFTVAQDRETGEILGYSCIIPLKREFAIKFEMGELDIQDVLAHTLISDKENPVLIDYMLDSLVLRNPKQVQIGAILMKHVIYEITKARKLYSIVSSIYGKKLMEKLKFKFLNSKAKDADEIHDFYVSCIYDSKNQSPIAQILPKEPIQLSFVCADCLYNWCYEWNRHVDRETLNKKDYYASN